VKRREFLRTASGVPLASVLDDFGGASEPAPLDVGSLFEANSPEVLALARRVMEKCVLEKIMPPTPPLKNTWIVPGGPYYKGQWIWDTMFVVDLLSILPGKEKLIRDVFQNYWDFQDRWNKTAPEYARDMITVAIKTEPQEVRQFSQIPILAWGVERVYRRNGDEELLDQCLGRLERFHDWYWRERDLHDNGLITLGAYTGKLQHARWETFDYECNMDDMQMTVHPQRKGPNEGAWYADICVPGNTAYLILGERSLARLAEIAGEKEMAARRKLRVEKGVQGMREHMWDEAAGTFLSVWRDTREKIPVATRLDDAAAGAHGRSDRQAMEVRRLLARRRLAADELPDRLGAGRPWSQGACRGDRRQDRRQRDHQRHQRALRFDFRQAAGRTRLLHEQYAGDHDARRAEPKVRIEVTHGDYPGLFMNVGQVSQPA